jgi:CRISPR-associated endonuclease Cas1
MAVTKTVAQRPPVRKSDTENQPPKSTDRLTINPRHGVVTLCGFGINVRVNRGHLILEDGVGDERRAGRLARIGHGLERLVVIGNDGLVSLAALRWLADQSAAFVMLEWDGSVLLTTGPVRPSDAKLRRAQARANDTGAAIQISRALIHEKLAWQEDVARNKLKNSTAADAIAKCRTDVPAAPTIDAVRFLEAKGTIAYWSAWGNLPVTFPRAELARVPEHWRTFGTRSSPLTSSPQRAVNPANAMLNYLYTVLAAEARLAIAAIGLDPGLGFIHSDAGARDSLAYDLTEPVRAKIDGFVFDFLNREALKREWFFEQRDGNCRLMADFAARLGETASMWRQGVDPFAEWVVHALMNIGTDSPRTEPTPTRLTNRRVREAQGGPPLSPSKCPPRAEGSCRICGITVPPGNRFCRCCQITFAVEQVTMASAARDGCHVSTIAQAQRSATKRQNDRAMKAWIRRAFPTG